MDGKIVFCNDGVLRFQSSYDDKRLLPLASIQVALDHDPAIMILSHLDHGVLLQSGSTIGTFLLCLEPWAKEISALTDRDVQSYISEIRKPSSVENAFDRIEIRHRTHVSRAMVHDPCPPDVDFLDWLNRPRDLKWSNTWNVDSVYDICGYCEGDDSNYSISTNIHKLKNVPLVINRQSLLVESQSSAIPQKPLFQQTDGAFTIDGRSMVAVNADLEVSLTFQELIATVISHGLWYNTPQGCDRHRELLEAMSERVREELIEAETDDAMADEALPEDEDADESSVKKVVIAPGAFDSVIQHTNREVDEWDVMVSAIARHATSPRDNVYVGSVTEDLPADQRMFGVTYEK